MARSFLTPINLNSLELQNFLVHNVTGDPTGVAGRLVYNSTENALKFYKAGAGAGWQTVATGGSSITIGNTAINIGSTASTITALTVGAGSTWNGNTIGVAYGGTGTATGSITGTGALTFTAGAGNNSINLRPTGSGSVDLGSTTGSDGFAITGLKDPSTDYDAANKKYVDGIAAGLNAHAAVAYATTGALGTTGNLFGGTITTTYSNGTSGVGATLTIATSTNWTDILIDGQNVVVGDRILIKNQGGTSSSLQNGIYVVTSVGGVGNSTSFVFTRATDYNSTPEISPGDTTYVIAGSANGKNGFVQTATIVAIGTTPIAWTQHSGSSTTTAGLGLTPNGTNPNQIDVSPGTGLAISGDTIALANTAVTAGTYGSASSVSTFTVDAQGRLTAASNTAIASLNASVITAGTLTVGVGGTGATTFTSGGILRGNGTSALSVASSSDIANAIGSTTITNATNATYVNVTESISGTYYLVMSPSTTTGNKALAQNSNANAISYVASTGALTATSFVGSGATLTSLNASNVASGTLSGTVGVTAGSTSSSFVTYNGTTSTSGQFDGGTTAPSNATRLNYNGYLYVTQLFPSQSITLGSNNFNIEMATNSQNLNFYNTNTTGNLNIGSALTTGNVNIATGTAFTSGAVNIGTGAMSANTKAINIGTGGLTGSTTNITIGTNAGTPTTIVNGTVRLGATAFATDGLVRTSSTNGTLSIATAGTHYVVSLTGTTNRATVSGSNGVLTVTTPQDIHTAATPQFAGLGLGTAAPAAGATITGGKTTLAVHAAGYAGLNIPSAATVITTPASGDIWNLSGVLQFNTGAATKQIAFTDSAITGSVASLTTSRDIWGQSFNGTANVTGSLTSVANITGSAGNSMVITSATSGNGSLTLNSAGTGTISIASPASTSASTGAVTIQSGSASVGTDLTAGTVTVDTGTRTGTGTAALNLGTTNAVTIGIGRSGSTTTISGNLTIGSGTGFLKVASGVVSAAALAYSDLPTSSLTGITTDGIARKKTGTLTANSSTTDFTINHQFGQWVTAQLFDTSGNLVEVDVINASTSSGTTTFRFTVAPTTGTDYKYVIVG